MFLSNFRNDGDPAVVDDIISAEKSDKDFDPDYCDAISEFMIVLNGKQEFTMYV